MADISNLSTGTDFENLRLPNGKVWRKWEKDSPSRKVHYTQAYVSGAILSASDFSGFFDSFHDSTIIVSLAEELACDLDDIYSDSKNLHIPINMMISTLFNLREEGASEAQLMQCLENLRLAFWHTVMKIRQSLLQEILMIRP